MSTYSIALFLHILGAVGLFIALAYERLALYKIQRSKDHEHAMDWVQVLRMLPKIGISAALLVLPSGIYLTEIAWRAAPWTGPALVAFILMAVVGAALSGPGYKKLEAGLSRDKERPSRPPLPGGLWISLAIRTGLALGILFIMITKPTLMVTLLALLIAVVLAFGPAIHFFLKCRSLRQKALRSRTDSGCGGPCHP